MKRKALYVLIVTLLLSAIMVSCNSEVADSASQGNKLVNVTVMEGVPKSITVSDISGTDVESLYWFYTANKTDGSIFIDGQTDDVKTPVKKNDTTPIVGLVNSDLGLFSTGSWTFSFWGYKADDVDTTKTSGWIKENAKPVYYQENLAATVVARTDLTLTLVEGEGMEDATLVFNNPTWTYELAPGETLTLRVFDGDPLNGGEELDLNGSSTEGKGVSATTNDLGVATFNGIVNQTRPAGAHTLYFVVYHNNGNVDVEVGRTILGLNLKKGTTYTLSGSIENLNETYHVWVKYVNQTTVIATKEAITTAQAVDIVAPVTPLAAESSTAVTEPEKKTTVKFESGALDHTTESTSPVDTDGKTTTTKTESTHDLEVEVKTAATASSAQYVVSYENTPVAGVNLTLTKNTTVTETVNQGETQISQTTTSSSSVLTEFNNTYVTIRTYIGKGLSDVKVYYNGTTAEQPKFSEKEFATEAELNAWVDTDTTKSGTGYVPSTGLLVFKTKHFSEFFVTSKSVARIGEVHYGSLQAAIDAAKAGETIVLLESVSQSDGYIINKSLSLDTNGKTITVTSGSNCNNRAFRIDKGTFEVYGNGTIVAQGSGTTSSDGAGCYGAFLIESNGNLVASNLTLTNARPWGLNVKVLGGTANLTNVTITSSYGGGIEVTEADLGTHSKTGSATLTNCTFTQTGYFDHCSTPLSVSGGSELIVNGGTYTSENHVLYVFSSGGVITVNNGSFNKTAENSQAGIVAAIDTSTYPQYTGGFKINGGVFTCDYSITSPAYMSITGGTFDHNPSAYVPRGYDVTENSTTPKTWTVSKHNLCAKCVAKIAGGDYDGSDIYFDNLQDAIDAAYAGETVSLLKDLTLSDSLIVDNVAKYAIAIEKTITLDGCEHVVTAETDRVVGIKGKQPEPIDVTIRNITLNASNRSGAQVIMTRDYLKSLTLENVKADNTKATGGNIQAITISGTASNSETIRTINIKDSEILNEANKGYSIICYAPCDMTLDKSTVKGWACLYFKGEDFSGNTSGSSVNAENCTFTSNNTYDDGWNAFGAVVFEDSGINCEFKKCTFDVSQNSTTAAQSVFSISPWGGVNRDITLYVESGCSFNLNNGLLTAASIAVAKGGLCTIVSDADLGSEGKIFEGLTFTKNGSDYECVIEHKKTGYFALKTIPNLGYYVFEIESSSISSYLSRDYTILSDSNSDVGIEGYSWENRQLQFPVSFNYNYILTSSN